jgi:hypothetical protein
MTIHLPDGQLSRMATYDQDTVPLSGLQKQKSRKKQEQYEYQSYRRPPLKAFTASC